MLIDTLINRPAAPESANAPADRSSSRESGTGLVFDELLAAGGVQPQSAKGVRASVAAAAELMRLDMMRSAFTIGDVDGVDSPPATGRAVELMLKSFAENGKEPVPMQAETSGSSTQEISDSSSMPRAELNSDNWLDDVVSRASRRYGVEVGLIKAVIKAESNFNPNAVSPVGARGLMQLMPATARGLGVTDSFDPEQNVMAGTRFLKDLLRRYDGNIDKALAAYNWGPGNVDRKPHLLPRETREYLVKVKGYYNQFA